jgi:hypothetical protein
MTTVLGMTRHDDSDLLAAGGYVLGVAGLCIGAGAAIGAAAGDVGIGVALGAVVGIPASIGAVILRYRNRG